MDAETRLNLIARCEAIEESLWKTAEAVKDLGLELVEIRQALSTGRLPAEDPDAL